MTKRAKIRAAGAVVLRGHGDTTEVLLIHRASYDDWSLPKGKGVVDELPPLTAMREVHEETGAVVRLGVRLPTIRYQVSKGTKAVEYWRAEMVEQHRREPDAEVDKVKWFPIDRAMERMTYADERRVLSAALLIPPTIPLIIVRHGKAMLRKDWDGPDQMRRLTSRGRRQAQELSQLLMAYGVDALVSSSSTRCMETLRPYSEAADIPIYAEDVLTEEEGTVKPKHVRAYIAALFKTLDAPTAVCGHRPVLPMMFQGVGLEPKSMVVGESVVVHRDELGNRVAVEVHKPRA